MSDSEVPEEFLLSLDIALRMVSQQPRVNFASKNPDLRDKGAFEITRQVIARLELAGWTMTQKQFEHSHVPPMSYESLPVRAKPAGEPEE